MRFPLPHWRHRIRRVETPRRLSPIDGDAEPDLRGRLRVFVDGDLLRDVIGYDCDEGWIMAIMHDDNGKRMARGDCWLAYRVFGDVVARWV